MGTSRNFPQSIIGYKTAMIIAQAKMNAPSPSVNILSANTSARLDADIISFSAGQAAITTTKSAYHLAIENAIPQRALLKKNVSSYYKTMNNCIAMGTIPASARAYYNLDITNHRLPDLNTDVKLLAAAAMVLSGDVARRAAGGIVMNTPTIAQFTTILNTASPFINAITTTETAATTAVSNLKTQIFEVRDLIKHIWDEVEIFYSLNISSSRRALCRLWGVRYVSTGIASVITGMCVDATALPLMGVKVRLVGSSHYVLTDALGNYSLNTSLYGDLILLTTFLNYDNNTTYFSKGNGEDVTVNVTLVHL